MDRRAFLSTLPLVGLFMPTARAEQPPSGGVPRRLADRYRLAHTNGKGIPARNIDVEGEDGGTYPLNAVLDVIWQELSSKKQKKQP